MVQDQLPEGAGEAASPWDIWESRQACVIGRNLGWETSFAFLIAEAWQHPSEARTSRGAPSVDKPSFPWGP